MLDACGRGQAVGGMLLVKEGSVLLRRARTVRCAKGWNWQRAIRRQSPVTSPAPIIGSSGARWCEPKADRKEDGRVDVVALLRPHCMHGSYLIALLEKGTGDRRQNRLPICAGS